MWSIMKQYYGQTFFISHLCVNVNSNYHWRIVEIRLNNIIWEWHIHVCQCVFSSLFLSLFLCFNNVNIELRLNKLSPLLSLTSTYNFFNDSFACHVSLLLVVSIFSSTTIIFIYIYFLSIFFYQTNKTNIKWNKIKWLLIPPSFNSFSWSRNQNT